MSNKRSSSLLLGLGSSDTVPNTENSANKRGRSEPEVQNTTNNAAAFKEKCIKVAHDAESEKIIILADALSNMEKSIQESINRVENKFKEDLRLLQESINRVENKFKEDLRLVLREEMAGIIKSEMQKEVKNLKIIYKEN